MSSRRQIITRIFRGTRRNIALLARSLRRGELVAVPTETVYGLAGNALSPAACAAIFLAKGRPAADPLIVHIHDLAQLDQLAFRNDAVEKLARAFWPGPLTLVLPKKDIVPPLVTSGLPSVAIRMPAHPLFRELLKQCALPLVAPSANPFGYISPTRAGHVRDGLSGKVARILDGGDCAIGLESTIVDLRDPRRPAILRPGPIGAKDIARVLRAPVRAPAKTRAAPETPADTGALLAPGMMARHYSPRTPVVLHAHACLTPAGNAGLPADEAVLPLFAAAARAGAARAKNIFPLARKQNLAGAARNLYAALRALDTARPRWKKIHAELAPSAAGVPPRDRALATAINDRLLRAAARV